MSRNGTLTYTIGAISGWDIIRPQPPWVEPVLESSDTSVVREGASIPNALERRNFIVAPCAKAPPSRSLICPQPKGKNVVLGSVVGGRLEVSGRNNPVIRIERRSVAQGTTFPLENTLSLSRELRRPVRVARWFERIHVARKGVRLLVGVAHTF